MNIVSWNCRGLGSWYQETTLRDLIISEKLTIFLLHETKLEAPEALKICKQQWYYCDGITSSSRGALLPLEQPFSASKPHLSDSIN